MSRIVVEDTFVQFRALALDDADQPISLFLWTDRALDRRARVGDVLPAIVRRIDAATHGMYLESVQGETLFTSLKPGAPPPVEGAHVRVVVVSESHAEKSARVKLTDAEEKLVSRESAFDLWRGKYGDIDQSVSGAEAGRWIDDALHDAVAPQVVLPGGGTLYFDATRALTAVDVDSSGRKIRDGVFRINLEAVSETARQVALRRLGGIIVVDLIGSGPADRASHIVKALRSAVRDIDARSVGAASVSDLGLLQFSIARLQRPVADDPLEIAAPVAAMLALHRGLSDHRAETVHLICGAKLFAFFRESELDWNAKLASQFGARFTVERDDGLSDYAYCVTV